MKRAHPHLRSSLIAAAVAALLSGGYAGADQTRTGSDREDRQNVSMGDRASESRTDRADARDEQRADAREARDERRDDAKDAQEQVDEAQRVVAQMNKDAELTSLLQQAEGVLIVPDFAKGAVGVGGRGGEGVLLLKQDGEWSGPAFYNFGRVSAGLQAGVEAGSVAMLLMTDDAVQPFIEQDTNFALDATAGLTVVDYFAEGRATAGESDVIVWSDTKGLFAGASIGVSGFTRDEDENRAYYQREATPYEIFAGSVTNPRAESLREALPTQTASR